MPSRSVVECPDLLKNVLKVLDLIVRNFGSPDGKRRYNPIKDVYFYIAENKFRHLHIAKTIGKNCVDLMNKSLCSHRYEVAVKLLWILCQDTTVFDYFIFKAAMFTLDNLNIVDKDEVMWDLLRKVQKQEFVNRKEIQLEYIIYGMNNNVQDLQRKAKEIISVNKIKHEVIDPINEAYSGFLQYAECFSNLGDIQPSQSRLTVENATVQFMNVIASPGNWDVFVLTLVKMLEFCDRSHEIEDVLLKYVECNPDHLNAHIYLCVYLYNYSPDSEKLIHHLKVLVNLCPSDERVLLLLEKWSESGKKLKECLKLIFMFLDYPSNGRNLQAWQLLSFFLFQVKSRSCDNELKKIQSLWISRCKGWHWLYFHPSQVPYLNECDYQLTEIKINVLSYLNIDHVYIKEVLKKFPTMKLPS